MIHSKYQKALFSEMEKQSGNIMVNAVAGSGKTYSLLECMKRVKGNSVFVAFNKSIATELSSRVPSHVTASTMHSIGLKAIRGNGYVRVDNKKLQKIMHKIPAVAFLDGMTSQEKADVFRKRQMITDLVNIWKNTMIDYLNDEEVATAANHYSVNYDPTVLGIARSVMKKSLDNMRYVDFNDMIYMPVALNLPLPTYDNIFVDECQDLNRAQIEMVLRMVKKPNGRIIAVGDPHQSIYGFRGADVNAMPRMQQALDAKELPLSVCYRCPTSHIELAQDIVPHIEAAPDADAGTIDTINSDNFVSSICEEQGEPMVLCRNNAPLVSYALKLIKQGKKAHIRGKDIGNYLRGIIIGFNSNTISELYSKIDEWENSQLEFLTKRWASISVKQTICDYADVMRAFAEQSTNPYDVVKTIDRTFSDNTSGIVLSTVHKAKGLQNDTVYIIRPDLMPLTRKDQKEWEVQQEYNLMYVAYTRSKNKLVFVKQ